MKIIGFMLVKNESDILAQTLQSLLDYGGFDQVLVFDNGSTDDTVTVAQRFASDRLAVFDLPEPFSDNLKFENVYRHQHLMADGDWFAILDADELYRSHLRPLVEGAEKAGANMVCTRSAQFYFTENDPSYGFDPHKPAEQQRPYYLVNYGEPRVYRHQSHTRLSADFVKSKPGSLKPHTELLDVFHFQFRSQEQTQKRLDIRLKNNQHSGNWGHIKSARWTDYMVPAKHLHRYDGAVRYGLPPGANLFKIRDNAAYTMANLNWLKKHNMLTPEQLDFFTASQFTKLLRKIL